MSLNASESPDIGDQPREAANCLGQPHSLHPSSIFFEAAAHVRQYLFPTAIALFSAAQGSVIGVGIALFVFAISLFFTLLHYFTLRYQIRNDELIVTEGLFFRRIRSVPVRRIQNMDLVQNILHRLWGVAEVRIETASGTDPEATLRVLTHAQIDQLREAILGTNLTSNAAQATIGLDGSTTSIDLQTANDATAPPIHSTSSGTAHNSLQLLSINTRTLALAGLASDRGIVLLGVVFGLFYQFDFDFGFNFNFNSRLFGDMFDADTSTAFMVLIVLSCVVGLLLLLRIFGVAWYILRFYDYQLSLSGDDFRISCGLFTKITATVPRRRIQLISVRQTLLFRLLGLASIRIETAGGAGVENENAAATVSRRWFIPVMPTDDVSKIISELRPGLCWHEDTVHWHGVSRFTFRRLRRASVFVSLIIMGVGLAYTRPWGFMPGLMLLPFFLFLSYKKCRAMRYARLPTCVVYRSGIMTRKMSFAFYDRTQALQWSQSPFDRRWGMATLHVDTAAAGPADHLISIDYLDDEFAKQQFCELQSMVARRQPTWA